MNARVVLLTVLGLAALPLAAPAARAADPATLPRLVGLPDDPFTDPDRQAITAWTLAQPEVRARIEGKRTRLLQVASGKAKGGGHPYRMATLFIRNYDDRVTHKIMVNLTSGRLDLMDLVARVQPSDEEVAEAIAIIRADTALAPLNEDERLNLDGGFYVPSTDLADPCARDVCMQFGFMKPNFEKGPARMVIVDLNRQRVVHYDYKKELDAGRSERMTEAGGN